MQTLILDFVLPASMVVLMTGMGLTLTPRDFRRIVDAPGATVLGTVLQLVAMPVVGIALALAFDLPPYLAAGLVVIAACPGGMFSNVFVHIAGANTALSITLTASATMVTLFTMPLWVRLVLDQVGVGAAEIHVPVVDTALRLGGLTVLPIATGMLVRAKWPESVRLEKGCTRVGALGIVGALTYDALRRPELPVAEFEQSLLPAFLLIAIATAMGLGSARAARLSFRDAVTLTLEMIVKNSLLGLVLARSSLAFEATIPIVAFSLFQTPLGVAMLTFWRWAARRAGESLPALRVNG